jgi:hypothetical protein
MRKTLNRGTSDYGSIVLTRKPVGKRSLGSPRYKLENNITRDVKEIG